MNVKNKHLLLTFLIFLISLPFLTFLYASPNSQSHKLDTSTYYFKLDNGCRLKFSENWIFLGDSNGLWSWLDDDGIKFYNLKIASSECANPWHIRLNGQINLTITELFQNKRFAATIDVPSETTSTTKVYCGDKGEPIAVYLTNGTLTWSYNASIKILELNVEHSVDHAGIVVYWKIPGDIDGDVDVDPHDFAIFAGAYGPTPPGNPECDLDCDGDVDPEDFAIFAANYGKTELQ